MDLFDRHDITEILLKVALNTINLSQTNQTLTYKMKMIVIVRGSYNIVLTECKRTVVLHFIVLIKESLNSDGQQFHQYQQSE
jgi:hypothetical protein